MTPIVINPIAHSRADSASREYDAESKLDFEEMLTSIADWYSQREGDNMENTSVYEICGQIKEWRDWYIGKYPTHLQRASWGSMAKTFT
jgi:hypothetical protein